MYRRFLLIVVVTISLFACNKNYNSPYMPTPDPVVPSVLLKDVVIPNLPSPYYHFEYDAAGKVAFASFASDFTRYNVLYDGGHIKEMRNNILVNKDRLQYSYDISGRVKTVTYADSTGVVYTIINLAYDGRKLIKLERESKSGAAFVVDKTLTMSYHPDGNLKDLTYHFVPANGQPQRTYTDRFEQYDDKINVDGFGLIHHEFFDHLVLLPEVQLQKNNPRKETRTGDAENYTADYTYTYNDKNAPLTKNGNLVFLTGAHTGEHFNVSTTYSYY